MELIPIFSLIVLVATIGTFILSVGAYILFKIREARTGSVRPHPPGPMEAEVVSPNELLAPEARNRVNGRFGEEVYREFPAEKKFMKYTPDGYVPVSQSRPEEASKWR